MRALGGCGSAAVIFVYEQPAYAAVVMLSEVTALGVAVAVTSPRHASAVRRAREGLGRTAGWSVRGAGPWVGTVTYAQTDGQRCRRPQEAMSMVLQWSLRRMAVSEWLSHA